MSEEVRNQKQIKKFVAITTYQDYIQQSQSDLDQITMNTNTMTMYGWQLLDGEIKKKRDKETPS